MVYLCIAITIVLGVMIPLTLTGQSEELLGPSDDGWAGDNDFTADQQSGVAAVPDPLATGTEVLAFDWNKILASKKGRYVEGTTQWQPNNTPVKANFDWNAPPNFSHGTYYTRVLIRKMKKNDDFKLIFNHWQFVQIPGKQAETNMQGPELTFSYRGAPITRTFAYPLSRLNDNHTWDPKHWPPFNWSVKRDIVGFFFPAVAAAPPSAKIDLGAFPIDIRFTIVVVAPGATFSGWQNYP